MAKKENDGQLYQDEQDRLAKEFSDVVRSIGKDLTGEYFAPAIAKMKEATEQLQDMNNQTQGFHQHLEGQINELDEHSSNVAKLVADFQRLVLDVQEAQSSIKNKVEDASLTMQLSAQEVNKHQASLATQIVQVQNESQVLRASWQRLMVRFGWGLLVVVLLQLVIITLLVLGRLPL